MIPDNKKLCQHKTTKVEGTNDKFILNEKHPPFKYAVNMYMYYELARVIKSVSYNLMKRTD